MCSYTSMILPTASIPAGYCWGLIALPASHAPVRPPRARADAQREREHRHDGEPGLPPQLAHREAQVVQEVVHVFVSLPSRDGGDPALFGNIYWRRGFRVPTTRGLRRDPPQ